MAITRKCLGQEYPSGLTPTAIYTCPAATEAVISSITAANCTGSPDTFSIALRCGGAPLEYKHVLFLDVPIPANDTFIATIGICMSADDILEVTSADIQNLS